MAISATKLKSITDTTDLSAYSFASQAFANAKLYLIFVSISHGTLDCPSVSSIAGGGLTWVQVAALSYSGGAPNVRRVECWRAMVASGATTDVVTVTLTGNLPATHCHGTLVEVDGVNTGGTNGSAAVGNTATGSGSALNLTVNLSSVGADNRPIGYFSHRVAELSTEEAGYTELDDMSSSTPSMGSICEWHATVADTSVSASWATSAVCAGIGVELIAGAAEPPNTQPVHPGQFDPGLVPQGWF